MWRWIVLHKSEIELISFCWMSVQIAAGMPTPNGTGPTARWWYRWLFNIAHSITNLPRLLATAFPQVSWVAALFGIQSQGGLDDSGK